MVEDALKNDGHIGMIQSKKLGGDVFRVGCLGKIDKHEKTPDGRILINLKGLTRFSIKIFSLLLDSDLLNTYQSEFFYFIHNSELFLDVVEKIDTSNF